MPTKPSSSFTFATGLNYTVGPFIGSATKVLPGDIPNGFVPGTDIVAEWNNYMFEIAGDWITTWVLLGSDLATVDAHIVETDSGGATSISSMQLGSTAGGGIALRVVENSGAPGTTLLAINASGNDCIFAQTTGGAGDAVTATCTGIGAAVKVNANSTGLGIDVATTGGTGIKVVATGVGDGATLTASGTGLGVQATREPLGGPAGYFQQNGGATPLRGILALDTTATPSAPVQGDFYVKAGFAGFGRGGIFEYDDDGATGGGAPGFQKVWTTAGGQGFDYAASEGVSTDNTGVYVTKTTLSLDSVGTPGNGEGEYVVTWNCAVSLDGGSAITDQVQVEFSDDTGVIGEFVIDFVGLGAWKQVSATKTVTLGAAPIPMTIKFRAVDNPNQVQCKWARISAQGAYEA